MRRAVGAGGTGELCLVWRQQQGVRKQSELARKIRVMAGIEKREETRLLAADLEIKWLLWVLCSPLGFSFLGAL